MTKGTGVAFEPAATPNLKGRELARFLTDQFSLWVDAHAPLRVDVSLAGLAAAVGFILSHVATVNGWTDQQRNAVLQWFCEGLFTSLAPSVSPKESQ
jgi:hypothetical protein